MPDLKRLTEDSSDSLIKVRNSGLVRLQYFEDPPDGNLAIGEVFKNIPFAIKRFYFINSLSSPNAVRGKHAHRNLDQVIFCINGSFVLHLDDGLRKQIIKIETPYVGVRMTNLVWHEMTGFSKDCVILVVTSDYYNQQDYIRDYEEFLDLARRV